MYLKKELLQIREYMDKLSNGIDPITNIPFPSDTILNNKKLSIWFKNTSSIIDELLSKNIHKKDYHRKNPFTITEEQKLNVIISDEPLSISAFVYRINNVVDNTNMRKLVATQITNWLLQQEYLKEIIQDDGKNIKIATEKANEIGIINVSNKNTNGEVYSVNLYNKEAQNFILYRLNDIVNI